MKIDGYTLPDNQIQPLDLTALRAIKVAKEIGDPEVGAAPMVDAAYVAQALDEMATKLNEVIKGYNSNNYDEQIQTVAAKLNQVVGVLNRHTTEMAKALDGELKELSRDLPKH